MKVTEDDLLIILPLTIGALFIIVLFLTIFYNGGYTGPDVLKIVNDSLGDDVSGLTKISGTDFTDTFIWGEYVYQFNNSTGAHQAFVYDMVSGPWNNATHTYDISIDKDPGFDAIFSKYNAMR